MNLPMQAAPVMRGSVRAYQTQSVTQSCNWLQCVEAVAGCAAQCIPNPLSGGCVACLGPLWDTCKSCF
jgi:hypothetical protein